MDWFDGRELTQPIPEEAISACTQPGRDASDDVNAWVEELSFDAPDDLMREYLRGFGAWDDDELASHDDNVRRLFWVICGDMNESGEREFFYLGN